MTIRMAGQGFRDLTRPFYDRTLSAAGKFDITGIPPSHRYIKIILHIRSDEAITLSFADVFFNNDTTAANYRHLRHVAVIGGHAVIETDDANLLVCVGASAPADNFSHSEILIIDYANSVNKQMRGVIWGRHGATATSIYDNIVHWENNAVINQVTVQYDNDPTNEFIAGSRATMWLIR